MTKRDPRLEKSLPLRVEKRPAPSDWTDDELLTLEEAASLYWPDGPLTTNSLRTAVRDGRLGIVRIAGKILTTKTSISLMSACEKPAVAIPFEKPWPKVQKTENTIAELRKQYLARVG